MTSISLEIELRNPFRALDWRWRMAAALHERGTRAAAIHEDGRLATALRFLETQNRCEPRQQGAGNGHDLDFIVDANHILGLPEPARAIVEAGILTGEASELTACRANLRTGKVVDTYEALHYCVRDRLGARAWIHRAAIGRTLATDTPEVRRLRLMKRLAFRGGPLVLDACLRAFGVMARQETEVGAVGAIYEQCSGRRIQLLEILEDPSLPLNVVLEIRDEFKDLSPANPFGLKSASNNSRIVQQLVEASCLGAQSGTATTDQVIAEQTPEPAQAA